MAASSLRRQPTTSGAAITTPNGSASQNSLQVGLRVPVDQYWTACTTKDDARWEPDVLQRVIQLHALPKNWDGYSAEPVNDSVITFALVVINNAMRLTTPAPQIVPMSNGGLQLEWHQKGWDLELSIDQPLKCELYFRDRASGEEQYWELSTDYSVLHRKLDELGSR